MVAGNVYARSYSRVYTNTIRTANILCLGLHDTSYITVQYG